MRKFSPFLAAAAIAALMSTTSVAQQQTPSARKLRTQASPPPSAPSPPSAAAPAQASDMIDATDPDKLAAILKGFGIARVETSSSTGNPKISARADGKEFQLYFYGCTDNANCRSVQFWAYWDKDVALDALNAWNKDTRYGKVYLDEDKDVILEYDVNMVSGVSDRTFEDSAEVWTELLSSVEKKLINP